MAIVLTLTSGADGYVDANVAFHLAAGVDRVLVPESDVSPASRAALSRYGDRVIVVPGALRADELARKAVVDHRADWVLQGSANEFWWPRGDSLAALLGAIRPSYDCVQALGRSFVPQASRGTEPFFERMTHRLAHVTGNHDPASPWAPFRRLAIRGGAVTWPQSAAVFRFWYPIEVLRLPEPGWSGVSSNAKLVEDTRLRDALRAVTSGRSPAFARPDPADDAAFALEVEALGDADVIALREQADALAARLAGIERSPLLAAELYARRLVRPLRRRLRR